MSNKSNSAYYNLTEKDEYYTPALLVDVVLPFIKSNSVIWCPFDTNQSEFVKVLDGAGHLTIQSHIWQGFDFFNYQPPKFDYVISNPPFSLKMEVLERLLMIGKPFAMLLNMSCMNYAGVKKIVRENGIQLLVPDKNVSFDGIKSPPFTSVFYCYKMLPAEMVHVIVRHKNTGKYFEPSAMYNLDLQY
jgi:hypothetical protein